LVRRGSELLAVLLGRLPLRVRWLPLQCVGARSISRATCAFTPARLGVNPSTRLCSGLAASHSPGSPPSFLVGSPRFRAAGRAVGPIAAAGALVAAAYAAFRKCEPGLYTPILPNPIESS
jgi:hypothetical protein